MRRQIVLTLIAFMLASAHAASELILKPQAVIAGARVRLGDVSELRGIAPNQAETLAAFDLGPAPLPGYTDRYSRTELARRLRSAGLASDAHWQGAEQVLVERRTQTVTSSTLIQAASEYLRSQLAADGDAVVLPAASATPDLQVASGQLSLRPRPLSAPSARQVQIDLLVDGQFQRSARLAFTVHGSRTVLVARRDLPAGTQPDCADVEPQLRDIASLDAPPLAADCQTIHGQLRHPLPAGAPLLHAQLVQPKPVRQGEEVRLRLAQGGIVLESRAIALADGEIGERIAVRPTQGKATVLARVAATAQVEMDEK
ncbi:flagellar basal body P-ring formation chaperone FlgA [Chitinimonas sp.]|uniref:flagellar basal body P-ring formation chaperone FlgA n=1 Tax=Chitinimonas sp. TaxID=1934313 RepID=UPI0035B1D615